MSQVKRVYGWKRQHPDFRDFKFTIQHTVDQLPERVDLSKPSIPILDQGQLGSCTANAIAMAHYYEQLKQKKVANFIPSRLFIYYNERDMEGTIKQDSGAEIRDGIKSVANQGVCPETLWKYDIKKFKTKPSQKCYKIALQSQVTVYSAVEQSINALMSCLASGFPFSFGFSVYSSFESPEVSKTGIVPMPSKNESMLGGHAVLAVGYDMATRMFKVQNSWGPGWGDKGYFYLPFQFISDEGLASDFWKIETVE